MTAEYKRIIAFRNRSAAIRRGSLVSYSNADICAFTKTQGRESVFVLVNTRNSEMNFILPPAVAHSRWTDAMNGGAVDLSAQISLPAYSYRVFKK